MPTDFKKIFLIPNKKSGYRVCYDMTTFRINTPILNCVFGIETFHKEIINFEIINDTNEKNNFMSEMNILDNLFRQFSKNENINKDLKLPFINLPPDFIKDIENKDYISFYRKSFNGMTIRTHLKNTDVYKIIDGKKIPLNKYTDIKGKKCKCELEFSSIWVQNSTFGLLFYVTKIEII